MRDRIEGVYYAYCDGDYESVTRWLWIYVHVSILLATALSGYAATRERYLLALVPFPLVSPYKRYEKARTYRVHGDTPI